MEILFKCLQDGKRFYAVRRGNHDVFVGSRSECARFLEIHNHKVRDEHLDALRPQRNRVVQPRTYRHVRTTA